MPIFWANTNWIDQHLQFLAEFDKKMQIIDSILNYFGEILMIQPVICAHKGVVSRWLRRLHRQTNTHKGYTGHSFYLSVKCNEMKQNTSTIIRKHNLLYTWGQLPDKTEHFLHKLVTAMRIENTTWINNNRIGTIALPQLGVSTCPWYGNHTAQVTTLNVPQRWGQSSPPQKLKQIAKSQVVKFQMWNFNQ